MATTTYQLNLEQWIRNKWLVSKFGQGFQKIILKLKDGGNVEFDAVSDNKKIVGMISTSGWKTRGGKNGHGKYYKIRSDILSLLRIKGKKSIIYLLTEKDMYEKCVREQDNGKLPRHIEFYHIKVPAQTRRKLRAARQLSVDEIIVLKK